MKRTFRMLEFEKIRERLSRQAVSESGMRKALTLAPQRDAHKIRELQQETSEAVDLIGRNVLNLAHCRDLSTYLERAGKGGILNPFEIRELGNFSQTVDRLKTVFFKQEGASDDFPRIARLVKEITPLPQLVAEINSCITLQGEIKDQASPLLNTLKRREKKLQEKIKGNLESFIRSPKNQKYLQESIVTIRQNRYVLPIKQEFRNQVPGVVHDQSSSGMTLFIEPFPVLELNNQLREVLGKIDEEIERILRMLTNRINFYEQEIHHNYLTFVELDFISARGHLSLEWKGIEPELVDDGVICIHKGRHPLIPPEEVVPIDVWLGENFTTLVITGPNTGGKTVTLKTIGLFVLMFQSGLHLPADAGTKMGVFDGVWADIGDEQNIEQSLSTFSGHITNIINILKEISNCSLVLLDELGAGTDPSEGAALAMAILDFLHESGARTVATTHINDLKVFAYQQNGMENASMEFDPQTMKPLFRLLMGIPGQSNALIIAERLGMPGELVDKARSYIKKDFLELEKVVSDLVEQRRRVAQENRAIEIMKADLNQRLAEIEEKQQRLEHRRGQILMEARKEALTTVQAARDRANRIVKKMQEMEKEAKENALNKAEKYRKELIAWQKELLIENEKENSEEPGLRPLALQEIKIGSSVYIASLRAFGDVTEVFSEDEIHVQVGSIKINTSLADLRAPSSLCPQKPKDVIPRAQEQDLLWEKSSTTRNSIDLRGATLEEAVIRLEKYLDDSILAGLDSVEIIHGKGTGRLRQGIHKYLETCTSIAAFRLGREGEGGSGVTIARLTTGK